MVRTSQTSYTSYNSDLCIYRITIVVCGLADSSVRTGLVVAPFSGVSNVRTCCCNLDDLYLAGHSW